MIKTLIESMQILFYFVLCKPLLSHQYHYKTLKMNVKLRKSSIKHLKKPIHFKKLIIIFEILKHIYFFQSALLWPKNNFIYSKCVDFVPNLTYFDKKKMSKLVIFQNALYQRVQVDNHQFAITGNSTGTKVC